MTRTYVPWARLALVAALMAALAVAVPQPASATVDFGTLSNFDVFNDTGEPTHGFEIELEGLTSSDVVYSFGAPYERYGDPRIVDYPGGVYVRYESPYDPASGTFTQSTPLAPAVITPTDGHSCWNGAMGAAYDTSGCEHFGVSLIGNPTRTVYRWLVADPAVPGNLKPAGTKVSIPAPVWNVTPPPAGSPNPQPVVGAVIAAPEPDGYDFGDALWVKVFKTESEAPAELDHLLSDDPAVPDEPAETETEWFFLQAEAGHGNPAAELANEAQLGEGNKSVTRRYEIYEYTGVYDAESHEARPVDDNNPDPGDIGNYLGAQMAAVNIAAPAPPPPALVLGSTVPGEVGVAYSATLVSGGVPPYTLGVSAGALPAGLVLNPDGTLTGTPTAAGSSSFTLEVTDAAGQTATASYTLVIAKRVVIKTLVLPIGRVNHTYRATLVAARGAAPYTWALVKGKLPTGLSLDPATGVISGVPKSTALSLLTFGVTDANGATARGAVLLVVLRR